jgi:hypothetical protein
MGATRADLDVSKFLFLAASCGEICQGFADIDADSRHCCQFPKSTIILVSVSGRASNRKLYSLITQSYADHWTAPNRQHACSQALRTANLIAQACRSRPYGGIPTLVQLQDLGGTIAVSIGGFELQYSSGRFGKDGYRHTAMLVLVRTERRAQRETLRGSWCGGRRADKGQRHDPEDEISFRVT